MWPGQQPPGGEQNPQNQNNPYQQPGYQQPNPYQQPGSQQQPGAYGQQQWSTPQPATVAQSATGGGGGGGGNRTKLVAIIASLAVVVAAGVTGFLVLGGDKDDQADDGKDKKTSASPTGEKSESPTADPTKSGSDDNPRGGEGAKATVDGWKVVANPRFGTMFDVPADWEIDSTDTSVGFEWEEKDGKMERTTVTAPAYLKSEWCTTDENKDGRKETTSSPPPAPGARAAPRTRTQRPRPGCRGGSTAGTPSRTRRP